MPNPLYNPYLDFAPTFRWGGREYGAGDEALFRKRMGKRYGKWLRNHPTAGRVFDPTEQTIYGAYAPELNALDRARKADRQRYDQLMHNLGGFAGALGGLLGGSPGIMRDAYGHGADTMTSGGSMFGNQLNADQAANAASNNKELAAINAPEGAMQSGGDAGGVLAGAAGWIPATMLGQQGAAWADRMAHFPTEAALQANLMMKDLLTQAAASDKEFGGKISDVLAGLAGDRMKIQTQRQSAALDRLKADRDYAMKQAAIALATGKQKDYIYWKRKAYELDQRQQAAAENKLRGLDPDGNPLPGYRWNPKTGQVEKIPTKGKGAKNSVPKLRADISSDVADMVETIEKPNPTNPLLPPVKVKQPWPYKKAFATLWAKYKGTMPANKLRRIINEILAAAGITPQPSGGKSYPENRGD